MLNIPVHIWTTTGPMHEITAWALGVPPEPSYVPVTWDNFLGPVMSIKDRAYNLVQHYTGRIHALELDYQVTRLFRKYVRPDFPNAARLAANSAVMFINGDQFFDPVRPYPNKCVHIGGVGLTKPGKLSEVCYLCITPLFSILRRSPLVSTLIIFLDACTEASFH